MHSVINISFLKLYVVYFSRKKQLRLQAAASGAADDISDISTGSGSTSGCKRRGSEGPHCSDAKPITDPTLRNKLPSARVPGTKVTPRVNISSVHDYKIIKVHKIYFARS